MSGGALVLVATPIGNLGDLAPRAAEALSSADVIACEDTRRTGRLLELAGIARRRLLVVNDHSEAAATREVLALLDGGRCVVIVSDAGMPGISDPGERLVRAAASAGHDVSVVPGASAVVAALVVSGLPTGRFCFEGFLPRRGSGRTERLAALADERRTMVLYEAPHRLVRTLGDLAEALGPARRAAVVRELTKMHEEVWRGPLSAMLERAEASTPRGEFVIVVEGAPEPPAPEEDDVATALRQRLDAGMARKAAVAEVAATLGVPKREVYDLAVRLRADGGEGDDGDGAGAAREARDSPS